MEFILIDDSFFDLFTHEKLLLKSGLAKSVKAFASAQLALDHLRKQTQELPETVILLDIQMPEINGFEFVERYAGLPETLRKRIRLYMISSTVDLADIEAAETNGNIIALLEKPLDIPVLRTLIDP
jgi:CheY-like chemotaxis protein